MRTIDGIKGDIVAMGDGRESVYDSDNGRDLFILDMDEIKKHIEEIEDKRDDLETNITDLKDGVENWVDNFVDKFEQDMADEEMDEESFKTLVINRIDKLKEMVKDK